MEKHWKELRKKPNVIGYSSKLHKKIRKGRKLRKMAIRIYVSKKVPLAQLAEKDVIPTKLDGILTDVIEIGEVKALSDDPKSKYRPVIAGISAMNIYGTACTLGFFARDKETGKTVIVANNHCVARENKAKKGEAYVQPSPYDGGTYTDEIGKLIRYVPLKYNDYLCPFRNFLHKIRKLFKGEESNRVDAGCCSIDVPYEKRILSIGEVKGKREAREGELVMKCGRTTGFTTGGKIIDTAWNGVVQYSRGRCWFEDCVLIQKRGFSAGGDSSSAIIAQSDRKLLGLLFAGSDTHTIFCKVSNIEKELGVEF